MKELPKDPGKFAGLYLSLELNNSIALRTTVTQILVTGNPILVACWAHAAWTAKAESLGATTSPQIDAIAKECEKEAAAWLAVAQGKE
jgi:hypothetical protein